MLFEKNQNLITYSIIGINYYRFCTRYDSKKIIPKNRNNIAIFLFILISLIRPICLTVSGMEYGKINNTLPSVRQNMDVISNIFSLKQIIGTISKSGSTIKII